MNEYRTRFRADRAAVAIAYSESDRRLLWSNEAAMATLVAATVMTCLCLSPVGREFGSVSTLLPWFLALECALLLLTLLVSGENGAGRD